MESYEPNETNSHFNSNAKMVDEVSGGQQFPLDKYTIVPRPKVKSADDEIRIASEGSVPRYVTSTLQQLQELNKTKVTLKATGTAISVAITVAEIVKRRVPNIHQENRIDYTTITDTLKALDGEGREVLRDRQVAVMEIIVSKNVSCLNVNSIGYQEPIDQSLVKVTGTEQHDGARQRMSRNRRGTRRGQSRFGSSYRNKSKINNPEPSHNSERMQNEPTNNEAANRSVKQESAQENYSGFPERDSRRLYVN